MKIRCAVYVRVSTIQQDTDNQLRELIEYAEKHNWQIVKIYKDEGVSGSKDRRPALDELFNDARRRRFAILLFWSLDRFSREGVLKTVLRLNELEAYGVKFVSYTEPYLSSLGYFRDAIVALLAALAKQERVRISERIKTGLRRAKAEGIKLGRPKIKLNIDEIIQLRRQGLSLRQIAKRFKCSKSKIWTIVSGYEKGKEGVQKTL